MKTGIIIATAALGLALFGVLDTPAQARGGLAPWSGRQPAARGQQPYR